MSVIWRYYLPLTPAAFRVIRTQRSTAHHRVLLCQGAEEAEYAVEGQAKLRCQ